ncbi:lipase/acyltransferase domain-containing protein [Amycolatopsis sp. lyj-112]|uniref:PGAP1-like alpha/beta domain-containing protein n=1 Tax=Amycolatopsis sp. lyj-112 TaxID=2789288 RepID=UPI00397D07DA
MTPDAVMVVPGIMGSELMDTTTGKTIWGLRPKLAVSTLLQGMGPLVLTDAERSGDTSRVKPVRLLKFPAYLPGLTGLEPYTGLVRELRGVVRHPSAVAEFAYDWRLPVKHNAALLADAIDAHLEYWQTRSDRTDARIVLVAHSMGGLLCQAMAPTDNVRATVTLGTPFDGAAKAALMLAPASGRLRQQLRAAAATMPGLYDLLPAYRCVDIANDVRPLTVSDVVALGGDEDLATEAFTARTERVTNALPQHWALIGVEQPTMSTLTLNAGMATGTYDTFELHNDGELVRDEHGRLRRSQGFGDGTVPRNSALPHHQDRHTVLAQQHTTLAQSDEAVTFARDIVQHGRGAKEPRLGAGDIGLVLPDVVAPGQEWTGTLSGIDDPFHVACTLTDADADVVVDHPMPHRRDGQLLISGVVDRPGLYRLRVDGGSTPVVQFLLAVP